MVCVRRFDRLIVFAAAVALLTGALIGVVASAPPATAAETFGGITAFALPTTTFVEGIAQGSDGNLWFTEHSAGNIGRITPTGTITEFPIPTEVSRPWDIAGGPDGALWFTESWGRKIGRITTDGTITEFDLADLGSEPHGITAGGDGNMWFTEHGMSRVASITPAGVVTEYPVGPFTGAPDDIVAGPDGNVWATSDTGYLYRVSMSGQVDTFGTGGAWGKIAVGSDGHLWVTDETASVVHEVATDGAALGTYPLPASSQPQAIAAGPDGNLWIAQIRDRVQTMTTDGVLVGSSFLGPENRSPGAITAGPDGNMWVGTVDSIVRVGTVPTPFGEFTPLPPTRILDTRTPIGGHQAKLGPGQSLTQQLAGQGGVPASGAAAVVVNVTVTESTSSSHMTVWPTGDPRPQSSNLNYVAGQTVPNLVTVALGGNGQLDIYNDSGSTHVIVDVVGYYASPTGPFGSRFHPISPSRYFDTRTGTGGVPVRPLNNNEILKFKVTGKNGVPASGVTAVMMNVTETQPTSAGFLTVYPDGGATPNASNLNFVAGLTAPNLVVVKVPASGIVDFFNLSVGGGTTHLLADVVGYFDADTSTEAGRFMPASPVRLFDSRLSSPAPPPGCIPGGGILGLQFSSPEIGAFVFNVTVTQPIANGHVTVFPGPPPPPNASSLNYVPGQTVPNQVVVKPGESGVIDFYNYAGCTHLVIDAFGYFTSAAALVPVFSSTGMLGAAGAGAGAGDPIPIVAIGTEYHDPG